MTGKFEQTTIVLYGQYKEVCFLCLDLIWKPIGEKVRFVLVRDSSEQFILMGSDMELLASDIIRADSHRFKTEITEYYLTRSPFLYTAFTGDTPA